MKRKNGYWTKEKCQEEALKYNSRTEFQKGSKGAYLKSYKNEWLDDICSHMKEYKKKNGYWTKEKCQEESLKYNKLKEFRDGAPSAYDVAYSNDFLYDICNHMSFYRNHNLYWTKERCKEESLKYDTIKDFKENNNAAYVATRKNGWLNEITSHLKRKINCNGYWTKERCCKESLKYNNKSDFRNKCSSAYNSSYRNMWLDEICSHMKSLGNKYKRCIYAYEFNDNHVYVGLTYNINKRHNNHMKCGPVFNHLIETKLQPKLIQLTDYIDIEDAKLKEGEYVKKYKHDSWYILNKAKTGAVGSNDIKWSKEKCQEESLKYKTRSEFSKKSSSVYITSLNNKWLDEICSHMILLIKPNGYWTKEKCHEESLKYMNREEFRKKHSSAYSASIRNGWLDEICSHMIRLKKKRTI